MFNQKRHHNFLKAGRYFAWGGRRTTGHWFRQAGWAVLIAVTAAVLVLLPFTVIAGRAYQQALAGRADLQAASADVAVLDLASALNHVSSAEAKFQAARVDLNRLKPFDFLPGVRIRAEAADGLLQTGVAAAAAAREALGVGQDLLKTLGQAADLSTWFGGAMPQPSALFQELTAEQKRALLASLAQGAPKLRQAEIQVKTALAAFDAIPDDPAVRDLRTPLLPLRNQLASAGASLETFLPFAELLPKLAGYPDGANYLLFLMNSTELRPTGGFLSLVGTIEVKDAAIQSTDVADVYKLDGPSEKVARPAAPDPIRQYAGVREWYLRDANWSPDFGVAAETMLKFWQDEYRVAKGQEPPAVLGLIAVTPRLAQDVLRLTGPITVDGHKFDADNLVDELEFDVEKGFAAEGTPYWQRKEIVGKLFQAVVAEVEKMSFGQLLNLVGAVEQSLADRDVQLWSADDALRQIIVEKGWDGRLAPVRGDFLAYYDANLAALKTDAVMARSISYSIAPDGQGGYFGKYALTYENRGSFTWKTTRYRTYARLYVPAGTELVGVTGAFKDDKLKDPSRQPGRADVGDDLGRRWFGAFTSVEPGTRQTLEFSFKLAPAAVAQIRDGQYRLYFQKQAGTPPYGLTLDLDFGKKLTDAEPAEKPEDWGNDRYEIETELKADRTFSVQLEH